MKVWKCGSVEVWKSYPNGEREAMSTEDYAKDLDSTLSPNELDELGISYDLSGLEKCSICKSFRTS